LCHQFPQIDLWESRYKNVFNKKLIRNKLRNFVTCFYYFQLRESMKAKLFFVGIIVIFSSSIYSQLIDSFSDGDFTNNPAWSGTLDNWQVVTNSTAGVNTSGSFTLRLNGPSNDSVQYLSVNRTETWG